MISYFTRKAEEHAKAALAIWEFHHDGGFHPSPSRIEKIIEFYDWWNFRFLWLQHDLAMCVVRCLRFFANK